MKEYTVLAFFATVASIIFDHYSGIRLMRKKLYYVLLACLFCFMLLVNGYLTKYIVFYDSRFFLEATILIEPDTDVWRASVGVCG